MKHPLFGLKVSSVKDKCRYTFLEFTSISAIVVEEDTGQIVTLDIQDVRFNPADVKFRTEKSNEQ
jgi:hypothetical protein